MHITILIKEMIVAKKNKEMIKRNFCIHLRFVRQDLL